MSTQRKVVLTPPPLPATNDELTIVTKPPTGVDLMKIAFQDGLYALVKQDLEGVDNGTSKTGKLEFDNAIVAQTCAKYARDKGIKILQEANLATLHRWFSTVLRATTDAEGNRLDRNSRKRRAIEAANRLAAPETIAPPENPEAPIE